jgi:branched-chain amino acid transport system permease protein
MRRLPGSQARRAGQRGLSIIEGAPLKLPRGLGTFDRPVAERIRAWGIMGTVPRVVAAGLVLFTLLYVVVLADPVVDVGNWRTTNFGSAIDNPGAFVYTLLDAVTFAGLLFIVASGFSLIFGLMRVVNMAHGSFYLLGGYIAYEIQQEMSGQGFSLQSAEVTTWEWLLPLIVAMGSIALFGLLVQQVLLRWNQGQDLRQALITIAISVIVADQVIAHFPRHVPAGSQPFGGNAVSLGWPGWTNRLVDLHLWGVQYSLARLTMLALGVAVGVALWLWLHQTRTGMVIRAGVDDRQMTSALGINIQITFAVAFAVGAALVAMGAVVQSSQGNVAQGQDGVWLLNSLVVVIIGGMGSLIGAAAGSLLFGLVSAFSITYLPIAGSDCCTQYSPVLTFVLVALVLAFRPQGLFGRAA